MRLECWLGIAFGIYLAIKKSKREREELENDMQIINNYKEEQICERVERLLKGYSNSLSEDEKIIKMLEKEQVTTKDINIYWKRKNEVK